MEPKRSSDVDLLTLSIAAVASGVAAYLTSQVWEGGTLISAALTPVIVALVKEALARPADRVTSLRTQTRTLEQPPREQEGQTPLHPPVKVYGSSNRRWKVAIISGLAAFVVVVAVFTVPELVAGKSIGRSGGSATTLFGGTERKSSAQQKQSTKSKSKRKSESTTEATATPTPEATATETPTATPSPTASPTVTATPTPTVAAPTTTPVP